MVDRSNLTSQSSVVVQMCVCVFVAWWNRAFLCCRLSQESLADHCDVKPMPPTNRTFGLSSLFFFKRMCFCLSLLFSAVRVFV